MSRTVVLVVFLAALAALLLLLQDDPTDARGSRADRAAADADAAKGGPGGEDGCGGAEAAGGEADAARATLNGFVVDEDDAPIAGASVVIRAWNGDDYADAGKPVETDASGAFALALAEGPYLVARAYHPHYQLADHYLAVNDLPDPLKIVMQRGVPLTVVVKRPDLTPAEGVLVGGYGSVLAEDWYYQIELIDRLTDNEGRAYMGAVGQGDAWISVAVEGFAPAFREIEVQGEDPVEVTIVLDHGGAIEGAVTAPDGTAVGNARVHLRRNPKTATVTDERGRYRLEAVPDWAVHVIAEADGFGPGYFGDGFGWGHSLPVEVPSGGTEQGVDIVLSVPTYIRGRVVDAEENPVSGIRVDASVDPSFAFDRKTKTDANGRFLVGPYALKEPAKANLNFQSADWTVHGGPEREVAPGKDLDCGVLVAKRRGAIRGVVYDVDGSPLRKGFVQSGDAQGLVRPDGTFEISGASPGTNRLVAWNMGKPRHRSAVKEVELEEGKTVEGIEMRLVEAQSVTGRVVTDRDEPRPNVGVLLVRADSKPPYRISGGDMLAVVETDKDGAFRFDGLLPGEYTVALGAWADYGDSYELDKRVAPVTVTAGAGDVVFRTSIEGGFVTGTVLSKRTGLPLPVFDVTLYRMVMFLPKYGDSKEFKDVSGEFAMEVEEPGYWAIEIDAKDHAPFRTKPLKILKGGSVDIGEVRLGDGGAVHGTVRDNAGRAVRWAKIHLLSPKLETNWGAPYTDKRGRFEVMGLAPGRYTLFAVSPRHPLALVKDIEVKESGRTRADVVFAASAPLTIRVVDQQSQPIADAKLIWTFDAIRPIDSSMVGSREPPGYGSNVSGADGVIRKPFFPVGNVYLKIEAKGYGTEKRTVELEPGQPKELEIRLLIDR